MPKSSRCWPGYEPVPGKPQHSESSCRPKAESKLNAEEKKFRAKRKRQLDDWQRKHPGSPRKAAQHLSSPASAAKPAARKAKRTSGSGAAKKATSKRPKS
jgi:hypothetical protein